MGAAQKIEHSIQAGAWFRQELLIPIFGITPGAARKYRERGVWLEGRHWRKDPTNRVVYNRGAIESWMAGND